MIRKQLTDHVFDQISVRLLDAAHPNVNGNMNQNMYSPMGFQCQYRTLPFFLEYPESSSLK